MGRRTICTSAVLGSNGSAPASSCKTITPSATSSAGEARTSAASPECRGSRIIRPAAASIPKPNGPKLDTNQGGGNFRDDSHLLPREEGYNLTAAAWIDQDGDGRPDILLGNGFHGLRLYRNKGPAPAAATPLKLGA